MRTAEAVVAWIDRPDRFSRNKAVGSYFGLVPAQDESAGTVCHHAEPGAVL